jgi:hypothetical protein
MPKSTRQKLQNIVPHPRYGDAVVPSGCKESASEVQSSFWRYGTDTIFPESAIKADTSRQNYTVFPRGYYADVLKQCRTCQRPFIFFAREQQHWYEVLGFYVDADCVHCPECRRSNQQLRRRFKRNSESVGRSDLKDRELVTLVSDATFLWQAGVLRDEQRLRRLRNLSRRRIPGSTATNEIDGVILQLEN